MTQNDIIEAIKAERIRQDKLHPVVAKDFLPACILPGLLMVMREEVQRDNSVMESNSEISWYDVFHEEFLEIFSETDPVKIKEEAIQLAALCVRLCESI